MNKKNNDIGITIQNLRKKINISQLDLAKRIFVTRSTISKWESGASTPNIDMLKKLSTIFNVKVEEIINGEEIHKTKTSEGSTKAIKDLTFSKVNNSSKPLNNLSKASISKITFQYVLGATLFIVGLVLTLIVGIKKGNEPDPTNKWTIIMLCGILSIIVSVFILPFPLLKQFYYDELKKEKNYNASILLTNEYIKLDNSKINYSQIKSYTIIDEKIGRSAMKNFGPSFKFLINLKNGESITIYNIKKSNSVFSLFKIKNVKQKEMINVFNKKAKTFISISYIVVIVGLLLLIGSALATKTWDMELKNTNTNVVEKQKVWEGISFRNGSAITITLFSIGLVLQILGILSIIVNNLWFVKYLSREKVKSMLGKKTFFIFIILALSLVAVIMMWLSGNKYDGWLDKRNGTYGTPVTIIKLTIVLVLLGSSVVLSIVHLIAIASTNKKQLPEKTYN